jgi:hypothetical protein
MIKQIDHVIGDLQKQVTHFRRGAGKPICVAVVGVNHAPYTVGYEGERAFKTDGKSNRHPAQEAAEAMRRLRAEAAPSFNEFIILPYAATNEPPFLSRGSTPRRHRRTTVRHLCVSAVNTRVAFD